MLNLMEGVDEYNNQGALVGIDGVNNEELMGALRRMNPIQRQRTINKMAYAGIPSRGSRAEMEKFFAELPSYIKEGLAGGTLRLADTVIYSIKVVNSKTIKMYEPQDDRQIGLRNISNAKLPKNQAFLVSGIFLLAGTAADATVDSSMATNFTGLETFPAIANGEFSLTYNKTQLIPETSNIVFKTASFHNLPLGYYKLANPRLIQDDVLIELTVELGTITGIPANSYLFAGMHGTITTP